MNPPAFSETITFSVFISSPGDLETTRLKAREALKELSGIVIDGKKVMFEPMLWEDHTPAAVGHDLKPQRVVDHFMGRADQMDIYVGMLWSRMGSPTVTKSGRRVSSGTLYEFETAYKELRLSGRPQMLLYRCTKTVPSGSDHQSQIEVAQFFESFRGDHPQYDGFPQKFEDDDQFSSLLKRDLEVFATNLIRRRLGKKNEAKRGDFDELVSSVRNWLATFEDLFGKSVSETQERERERLFPIHFRTLSGDNREPGSDDSEILPGKSESLLDVFDRWSWRVLMIGERGTGKTFAMLRLMQDLTDRAFIKRGEPVPVFFNLSSWNEAYSNTLRRPSLFARIMGFMFPQSPASHDSLEKWLEDQLVKNYSMQRRAAKLLLGRNQIIICLDGLDELNAGTGAAFQEASRELRDACVRAINKTLANKSVRMVLCSREETFHELTVKPDLGAPIRTQLLTNEEVLNDLKNWPKLEGLQTAMGRSVVLQTRARIALFLGMMRIAYQDMQADQITRALDLSEREWERHLLDNYVDQCMKSAPPESLELNKEIIPNCLTWMSQMPDNDFLLDDLQPSLLRISNDSDGEHLWRAYRRFSVSLLALSLMVIEVFPMGLSLANAHGYHSGFGEAVTKCLTMWVAGALILTPLYLGAFSARGWLRFGICFGVAWALASSVNIYLAVPGWNKYTDGSWEGAWKLFAAGLPSACIFFMLMGAQFFGRLADYKRRYADRPGIQWHEILPVEPMNWCWFDSTAYWRGGWTGLLVGPIVIGVALVMGESTRGTIAALIVGTMTAMFSGMAGTGIARVSVEPNQGMARSLRHALFMTKIVVIGGSLCWGIGYTLNGGGYRWIHGLGGMIMGLTLAFVFYVFGGWPVIQQYCLGTILQKRGKLPTWQCWPPWKPTVEFLDDLVRYKLLRRSAGGYMFRHQSLRDYYNDLAQSQKQE